MENLDERLLNQPILDGEREESLASRAWRGLRRGGKGETAEAGEEAKTLRQAVAASRLEKLKEKAKEKIAIPAKMATGRALVWAWTSLVPSFGLTLIYINMHVFLRQIFPDFFCKLGEEWLPKMVGTGEHSAKNVAGTSFGILEIIGLLVLDTIALFIILSVIALLTMIVSFMGAGFWEKIQWIWQAVGTLGWGAVQSLIDLFKVK